MAATSSAWDSLTGRRGVDIGTSFTRAWNERTGKTTKRSKDYPNPEYYSLRYNFKPESIDDEGAGTLTPKPGGDGHVFELERPSQQHGESHRFTAIEQTSKEWECVLLWDPATQQLTLEKLESALNLNYEGRGKGTRPASATPPSSTLAPGRGKRTASASDAVPDREMEELEKALTGYSDAEGEPDDDVDIQAEIEALAGVSRQEEEEEEEEEMEAVDVEQPLPPPPPPLTKPKPLPKAPPKSTPKAKPKSRVRPSHSSKKEVDDIEEEVLTFGKPTRKEKRPRRSSATYSNSTNNNSGLALPALPPTPDRHVPPTPSGLLQPPPNPPITYAGSDSGSDSEDSEDGGQDMGSTLDADALELELEQELRGADDDDEDEGMEAIPIENGQHNSGRPLSLNELFGDQSQGDDDTTTDDSDDD